MSFAVTHDGLAEGMALWVLAVDDQDFLLCGPNGFYWMNMADCTLARLHSPDNAVLVADVADMQQRTAGIVLPSNGKGF